MPDSLASYGLSSYGLSTNNAILASARKSGIFPVRGFDEKKYELLGAGAALASANFLSKLLAIGLILVASVVCSAQDPATRTMNYPGTPSSQSYDGVRELANLATGNVNLQIPLLSLPGRDGDDLNLSVVYNSSIWALYSYTDPHMPNITTYFWSPDNPFPTTRITTALGWNIGFPIEADDVTVVMGTYYCGGHYRIITPDGQILQYSRLASNCYSYTYDSTGAITGQYRNPTLDVLDSDPDPGSLPDETHIHVHLSATGRPTASLPNGHKWIFQSGLIQQDIDRNGNTITYAQTTAGGPCNISITDTVGRLITLNSCSSSVLPTTISYRDSNGILQTINLTTPSQQFNATFVDNPPGTIQFGAYSNPTLTSLTLPNGRGYTMAYDTFGELTKITYPAGGYTRYDYGRFDHDGHYAQTVDFREVTAKYTCSDPGGVCSAPGGPAPSEDKTTYTPVIDGLVATNRSNTITDPVGNRTVVQFYNGGANWAMTPYETTRTIYDGAAPIRTITQTPFGKQPTTVTTTLDGGMVSKVTYTYDTNFVESVTQKNEYAFGQGAAGALVRQTKTAWLKTNPANGQNYVNLHLWYLKTSEQILDGTSTVMAQSAWEYDNYSSSSGHASLVSGGAVQHDSGYGTGFTPRGNVTAVQRWKNTDNTFLVTTNQYDDAGNLLASIDPLGHTTTEDYTDSWTDTTCAPSGQSKAYPTKITNALNQFTTNSYSSCSGKPTSATDLNSLTTSRGYDLMGRLTQTSFPDGGLSTNTYNDSATPLSATTTTKINSAQNKVQTTVLDGLGRTSQSQLTSDPQGTVFTDTTYDALGRVYTVSNPYRSGTDATTNTGLTAYGYDALSRKITETYPDNSILKTAYCGPNTLVTDPTGKWRRSRTDALGYLVEVDEPNALGAAVAATGCPGTGEPIWVTTYTNDLLGNLTNVLQSGSHPRTFAYNSLSQLLTSANPETGTIIYTYNNDGTVATKKDARLITTTYAYDPLRRPTGVTYSNGDPALTFTYDQAACLGLTACQNKGHRTSATDGAGSEAWAYQTDPAGLRSLHKNQRTTNSAPSNITKNTTYYLDLAGNVTKLIYPTGRTINYTYNSANRAKTATDSSGSGITYATGWKTPPANTACNSGGACYTPQGSQYAVSLGQTSSFTGLNVLETYSRRLQPIEVKASSTAGTAMDITYNFVDPATSANAGHVYGITNNLNTKRSQMFTYDQLNRITSAGTTDTTTAATCWGNKYTYDAWANLLSQSAWTPTYNACTESTMGGVTADASNHISGLTYDTSGNTLTDGTNTYTWNGESQLKTAGGVTYSYDGDGRRAAKVGSKLYWYGSGGEILSETNAAGATINDYVFFGGRRVALVPATGSTLYYAEDFLGSSRVIVQSTGTLCYDADFTPFGAERAITNTCTQNAYKFEGKERDTETQNDDFGAREYSWRVGRWLSSDWSAVPVAVPYANLTNPQTLNLYSMVADDPESFADLDGHMCLPDSAGGGACGSHENMSLAEAFKASLGAGVSTDSGLGSDALSPFTLVAQKQDATKYKQEVVDTIKFQKDARAAYEKFGPGAKSVEELEQNVTKTLEKTYGEIGTAGSTNSSGQVEIKPDPNPYTRKATARHEGVHKQTVEAGIAKYGKDTPAFKQWFYNPQNWAKDEVKAYSAGIAYLEQSLRKMDGP